MGQDDAGSIPIGVYPNATSGGPNAIKDVPTLHLYVPLGFSPPLFPYVLWEPAEQEVPAPVVREVRRHDRQEGRVLDEEKPRRLRLRRAPRVRARTQTLTLAQAVAVAPPTRSATGSGSGSAAGEMPPDVVELARLQQER